MARPRNRDLEPGTRKSGYPDRVSWLKSLPKGSVGAEVGVLKGGFTRWIEEIVRPSLYWVVDCWCGIPGSFGYGRDEVQVRFLSRVARKTAQPSLQGRVRILCGWSLEVAQHIPDGSLDWVYLDADHTVEGCKADLETWGKKVKKGGIIAGHDFIYGWACSVPEAVRKYLWSIGREMDCVHTTDKQSPPTFWFRK